MSVEHAPQTTERQPASTTRTAPTTSQAAVPAVGGKPTAARLGALGVLALQRSAGNSAVRRAIGTTTVQRQGKTVSVGPVKVNNQLVTIPLSSATLQASVPTSQSVTWSLVAGTAAIDAGSSIDSTGLVTLGGTQAGGRIRILATDAGGSGATASTEVVLIKKPGSIASTSVSAAGGSVYGGFYKHTFAPVGGGKGSEMEGGRVNEIFSGLKDPAATSHAMTSPFGSFTLKTNNSADTAGGWGIDASGQMNDVDKVTIGRSGVDIRPLVTNTSNPKPAETLPASFAVAQDLRAVDFPAKTFGAPFVTVSHVRGLREGKSGPEFFVSANGKENIDTYTGPPAVRNIKASATTIEATPPPPPAPKGKKPTPVTPKTIQITAESLPSSAKITFSLRGDALGCKIDKSSGVLSIGEKAGSVKVRAAVGDGKSFDELDITITAPPAAKKPAAGTAGAKQSELDLEPEALEEQEAFA